MRGISYSRASIKLERKIIENQLCYPRMQPFKRGAQQKGRNIIDAVRKKLNVLHCITLLKSKSYLHTTLLKRNYFKSDVGFLLAKSYYLNIYFRFALENVFSINISFSHVISKGLIHPQSSRNKILVYSSRNFVTLNSFMTLSLFCSRVQSDCQEHNQREATLEMQLENARRFPAKCAGSFGIETSQGEVILNREV